jgi:uncharacterized membrane protein YqiK
MAIVAVAYLLLFNAKLVINFRYIAYKPLAILVKNYKKMRKAPHVATIRPAHGGAKVWNLN